MTEVGNYRDDLDTSMLERKITSKKCRQKTARRIRMNACG
jgi:hypothetical protein